MASINHAEVLAQRKDGRVASIPCSIGDYTVTRVLGMGSGSTVYGAHKQNDRTDIKAVKVSLTDMHDWHDEANWAAISGYCAAGCLADLKKERSVLHSLDRSPYVLTAFLDIHPEFEDVTFMEVGCLTLQALHEIWGAAALPDSDLAWIEVAAANAEERSQLELFSPCRQEYSMGQLARYFTAQLLSAIDHLQQNGVLHNDIKCANVLVMPDTTIRLSDFGCSKKLDGADDPQHDLKRLGSTVWLMATGQMAYYITLPYSNLVRLMQANTQDSVMNSFCTSCYTEDIDALVKHPWLVADTDHPLDIRSGQLSEQLRNLSTFAFAELPQKVKGYLVEQGVNL